MHAEKKEEGARFNEANMQQVIDKPNTNFHEKSGTRGGRRVHLWKSRKGEDPSTMADASMVSVPRVEKTVPIYESSKDSIVLRLSNECDDIICKLERFRFADNHEPDKRSNRLLDLFVRQTSDSAKCEESSVDCRKNLNEVAVQNCRIDQNKIAENDDDDDDDDDRISHNDNSSDDSTESSETSSVHHEEERLLERGPIKSQLVSSNRESPYWLTTKETPEHRKNETYSTDWEKITKQFSQNEEYNKKLHICLDQLQDAVRTVCNSWSDSNDQNASKTGNYDNNPAFETVNESSEEALLNMVSKGMLQPARSSENKFLYSQNTTNRWQELQVLSEPESGGSSPTCSIASTNCMESPGTVSATTYRLQQSPQSSNSSYHFSPSSSQSYASSPSPNTTHQVPIASQLGERLEEETEKLSFWGNDKLAETNKAAGNVAAVGNNIDTIDNIELELIDEVLREMEKNVPATKNATDLRGKFGESEFDEASSNGIVIDSVTVNAVSKSSGLNQTHKNVFNNIVPRLELSPASADAIVPNYPSNVGSPRFVQTCGWAIEPETSNTYSNTEQTFDFSSLCDESPEFSSSLSVLAVPVNTNNERRRVRALNSSDSRRRRHSGRNIVPWPSFNLPPVEASKRLKEELDPKEVEKAMSDLLKRSVEELAKQDSDGDTPLMYLVGNSDELAKKKAYLVPLVERLSIVKGALSVTNERGEDALYLAAINCPQFPHVTGYLAASMLQQGIDVSQRLYHTRGDTLIHSVAAQGDSHGKVLAELLVLKTTQGNPVFDLSKCNYDGKTALHVATESHNPSTRGISSVAIVELLLKYGADPTAKETKCGDNALHMAVSLSCDPALVKVLLNTRAADLVKALNYSQNTPLHLTAAVSNCVPLERQGQVCWMLMQAGGLTNISNRQGRTPLALVSAERKDAIKRVFYKRS